MTNRSPDHRNSQSDVMKAKLHFGALDGHIMAVDPDTELIRAVTPAAVYVYRTRLGQPVHVAGTSCHFILDRIEANDHRDKYTTNIKPLAELAWSEGGDTAAAMHVAGLWRFDVVEGRSCA